MDFVFMLTCEDRTIDDAVETLGSLRGLGLRHIGWKDIGSTVEVMRALRDEARHQGLTTYFEMVAMGRQAEERGAKMATDVGIDVLLGGVHVEAVSDVLAGTGVRYYPFVGIPEGHPTGLRGDAARIESDCRRCREQGCEGVDLLAYRAIEAKPLELVRSARAGLGADGRLLCAGGIASTEQLTALYSMGCDAFTIGSAVFERTFSPGCASVVEQVSAVIDATRRIQATSSHLDRRNLPCPSVE